MLKSYATSERQRRATDETNADARWSRDRGRAEGRDKRSRDVQSRDVQSRDVQSRDVQSRDVQSRDVQSRDVQSGDETRRAEHREE